MASSPARNDPPPSVFGRGPLHGRSAPAPVEKAGDAGAAVRRLWQRLARRRAALLVAALVVVFATALDVVSPWLIGRAIDDYILPGDLAGLARLAFLLIAVTIAHFAATWLRSYIMAAVAQHTVRDLRADLFARLQVLPLRYFDRRPRGEIMSRLTNDVESVNQVLTDGLAQLIAGALSMLGAAAVMLWVNPPLALVAVGVTVTLTLASNRLIAPHTRAGFRAQQASFGALSGLIEETVTGQRVVKAFARESAVIAQFERENHRLRDTAVRAQTISGFMGPFNNVIGHVSFAVITFIGAWMALNGDATIGAIAAFTAYSRQFGRPLNELANLYNAVQSAIAGAERVFAVIDEPAEESAIATGASGVLDESSPPSAIGARSNPRNAPSPPPSGEGMAHCEGCTDDKPIALPTITASPQMQDSLRGDVVFENVCFSYEPGVPVLNNVDLHAKPGQIIALIGPTGAGKTTIVNLLTRFYEIDSGRILLDGRDLRTFDRETLRRQLGIVLQDTFLFTGTVMENIRYGRLDASDDEVRAAAALANADLFIHRLPQGYDTLLSELGGNLSQGQRQMLAIARAVLADPRILILDEATSSVDTRTEQHIQEAMRRLMIGRTSFVIAHRLSTIRDADQILVVRGGSVMPNQAP